MQDDITALIEACEARGRPWVIASRISGGYFAGAIDEALAVYGDAKDELGFGDTVDEACRNGLEEMRRLV